MVEPYADDASWTMPGPFPARSLALVVADLAPLMAVLRAEGLSHRMIADRLNGEGHVTRTGKSWNGVQVGRVLERAGA